MKKITLALVMCAACSPQPAPPQQQSSPPSIDVVELSATDARDRMAAGTLTSEALTAAYLKRIAAVDDSGPMLSSVIELNPQAEDEARALDAERKSGKVRGPLHGIPILIKDNVDVAGMVNSAGSLALADHKPKADAFMVARLRNAGAVILGKTNLSEWANFRSTRSTSGWSARGGLTRNPYALDRNASGSSSGSGAAIAASLGAVSVGTETDGSIVSPSAANGLEGVKPTVGLVSRAGIIPIAQSQDTAGPMARSVADAAALLSVLAGSDPRDAATAEAANRVADYVKVLDRNALKGARLGVMKNQFTMARNDLASGALERALEVLRAQGAELVEVPELPNAAKLGPAELEVMLHEIKAGMASYLAEYAPGAPVKNLADLIAFNQKHHEKVMPYFGQELFVQAQAKGGLDSPEYQKALATNRLLSREEGIDRVLKEHRLDALIAPTGQPAWLTDFIKGDASGGGFTQPAAVAGYPHVTVPAGMVKGLPVGLSFVGTAWSEARLLALAYSFEQAMGARRAPTYVKTVNDW